MNIMKKISLIIPVFNVEPYVEKCLRRCAEQDLPSNMYEIIVINDGAQDNSLDVVKEVAKDYSNIIIKTQKNAGLSAARNSGLLLAKGEYIWFIDSDDWIEKKCLKKIVDKCFENSLDACAISAANVIENSIEKRFNFVEMGILSGKEAIQKDKMSVCVPFTIYRREFLIENKLSFKVGIFHEDSEFTPRAYYYVKKILFLNDILYFVRQNPTSITRTPNPKKAFDCITVAKSLSYFSKNVERKLKKKFDFLISMNINNSLSNTYGMTEEKKNELNKFIFEHRSLFKHLLSSNILKYKLEGILFYVCPKKPIQIYQIIQKLKN